MIKFGTESKEEAMKLGDEASNLFDNIFKPPHNLENEKTYAPYLLLKKKKYVALMWEKPIEFDKIPYELWKFEKVKTDRKKGIWWGYSKIDFKGIELKRRDNARIVPKTMQKCIDKLILDGDVDGAIKVVHDTVRDIYSGNVPMWELIISGKFTKTLDSYDSKLPHIELVRRLYKRDAVTAPKIGARIPYIVIEKGEKNKSGAHKLKVYERTEDPMYAMEHELSIDAEYYIKNQLMAPLIKIFNPILNPSQDTDTLVNGRPETWVNDKTGFSLIRKKGLKEKDDVRYAWLGKSRDSKFEVHGPYYRTTADIFPAIKQYTNQNVEQFLRKNGYRRIEKVKKDISQTTAYKVLFQGDHMKIRKKKIPKSSPLFNIMKKFPKCIGCGCIVRNTSDFRATVVNHKSFCKHCIEKKNEYYDDFRRELSNARVALATDYKTCYDCMFPKEEKNACHPMKFRVEENDAIFNCRNMDCETYWTRIFNKEKKKEQETKRFLFSDYIETLKKPTLSLKQLKKGNKRLMKEKKKEKLLQKQKQEEINSRLDNLLEQAKTLNW